MVIKTETCFFTEFKIYPGRGIQFVRRDGRLLNFISRKAKSLYFQRKKAQRLTWSQQWRRLHKKGKTEEVQKRRRRKTAAVTKAIVGVSIELLNKQRSLTEDQRKAAAEKQIREIKEKKRAAAAAKKTAAAAAAAPAKKGAKPVAAPSKAPTVFIKVPKTRQAKNFKR